MILMPTPTKKVHAVLGGDGVEIPQLIVTVMVVSTTETKVRVKFELPFEGGILIRV